MLQPKWLIFALLFFGSIMTLAVVIDASAAQPNTSVISSFHISNPTSWIKGVWDMFTWDYDWIPGDWSIFKYFLCVLSGVFGFLLAYEAFQIGMAIAQRVTNLIRGGG
jgi:hypothetical protein